MINFKKIEKEMLITLKLNAINKQTAQANLNMTIEMKSSMQNFIYKKLIFQN